MTRLHETIQLYFQRTLQNKYNAKKPKHAKYKESLMDGEPLEGHTMIR